MNRIGLVLSGGGAKGAYEVGVWKALKEMEVTKYIDGIIGTSVGALNAILFDTCDSDTARDIWLNLDPFLFWSLEKVYPNEENDDHSFSNQKKIRDIITKYIDFNKQNRRIDAVCCTKNRNGTDIESVFSLGNYNEYIKEKIILASAAMPHFFPPVEIYKHKYFDGGCISDNNTPRKFYTHEFKSTITVFLNNNPVIRQLNSHNNIDIIPSESLGNLFTGTIKVNQKKQKHDYELGYKDTWSKKKELFLMISDLKGHSCIS